MLRLFALIPVLLLGWILGSRGTAAEPAVELKSPLPPEQTLRHFRLAPGLQLELVAHEPDVIDPVALRFDESGRMWVVEMRDYPHGPAAGETPQSRIRILQDRDGDGRFEHATTFAQNLLFVTGVQPWRGGAIVTMAGRVAFMKDTNGDGAADVTETWYAGFAEKNSQLRANHPTLALDNQVYVANGLRGGVVADARRKDAPKVSISGMDFRFDPLRGDYAAVSGVGQFGLTFDDFGHRFVCSNRNPLLQIVIANRYLKKNPRSLVSAVSHDVATSGAASRVYPISRAWTTSTLHAGQFTAACGVTIYRGDLLPAAFRGNAFTCDPTGNLVHREVLRPLGAVFTSQPARKGVEFLASPDEWFRPVNMEIGPDGAIYLVDMYRAVIEHPQFVPTELKKRPDTRYGDDRGRIYRIVPRGTKRPAGRTLNGDDPQALLAGLGHSNSWMRETAARLILSSEKAAGQVPALREMARRHKAPQTRAQALWLLQGVGALDRESVEAALADKHPRVREQALRLAERHGSAAALRPAMRKRAFDSDATVRFQAALSLAPMTSDAEVEELTQIAIRGAGDVWTRRAVAIASGEQAPALAAQLLRAAADSQRKGDESLIPLVDQFVGLAAPRLNAAQEQQLLAAIVDLAKRPGEKRLAGVALRALFRGSARRRVSPATLLGRAGAGRAVLQNLLELAAEQARDPKAPARERLESLDLLAWSATHDDLLRQLSRKAGDQAVRIAAIGGAARRTPAEKWAPLLDRFRSESPAVRRAILDGTLGRKPRVSLLLDRVQSGDIKLAEIDRTRTNRLLRNNDKELKPRIQQLFAAAIPADRKKVLADYQPVLKMSADPRRGELVFRKNCATCHRIGKIGVDVAPDIADSRTKQPAQILTDILQPNRAIDSNYVSYSVITEDGRSLTGILAVETSSSITLRQPEGKSITLPREEIAQIKSNGISLMPVGLEKNIKPQQMADLISFIKNWRYLDGRTPLSP